MLAAKAAGRIGHRAENEPVGESDATAATAKAESAERRRSKGICQGIWCG
jgi:hypothetical protein